ncbi:hypothetical protein RhiirA5_385794 [Rhizophagus irregularis]|uniref:RRM domain-containing protein n=1 Tax=Rhizophagus irregularis TaxID=588596 RepID=A0A2N0NMJ3_9GLOM|nr:hypothetical protein RhiirA5_385794 [Rhizophagus irregularis]
MTNKRNNKASGTSAPKRPAQSPPSGNVQGQGSSTSTSGPTSQPLTDNSAKRTRVSFEPVMDQDNILTPPAPQDNTSTSSPPPVDTNASPSAPDSGTSLDDSQHSPSNSADKGKSVESLPPEPERTASPDASTAAIQSSPFAFMLRLRPLLSKNFGPTSKPIAKLATKATTQGSGDNKLIIVYFRSKPDMEKAIAAPITSLHDLQFHEHDPSAKKADEQLRTLVVTDIPLFVTDAQLRGTFSRYGIVTYCRTRLSKLYRTAYIVFDSATSIDQFENTWAVLCTGHCLRVCLASHSPDQRAVRRAHVALLASLPRGFVAADLSEIAEEVSAKSVNISFSYNFYNPKPYAYIHFSFAATKESAMRITCALKSIGLTWHEPTEVSSLCHRCGHPGCNPDKCASSRAPQRPSRPWSSNDKLRGLYNKHLPPSHPAKYLMLMPLLDHDVAAMDVPPLMDWQQITDQITIILEEISHLTTEFAQLQHRVKWLEDQHSSSPPPIPRSPQPQAPLVPVPEPMNQGWDNDESSGPRRLSDNLMDFSSPSSPPNGPNFIAQSHIPLPPRMSLILGLATSPQDRLSSLTATVTELTKTVKQGMAQQQQFLAARDNANSQ